MRKVNKILMATVSILLCLVLISTSVLSGIFAKYVITKKGSASATFKAFGVTLNMTVDETKLKNAGATVKTDEDKHKVTKSVTITGLKMAPGVELDKIINIELTGTPTVNCRFKLDIDFDFDTEKFIVPYGEYNNKYQQGYLLFPLYLTFVRTDGSGSEKTFKKGFESSSPADEDWELGLYTLLRMDSIYFDNVGGYNEAEKKYENAHLYRDFEAGTPISLCAGTYKPNMETLSFDYFADTSVTFNKFDLGFNWPFEESDAFKDEYNNYETYIINNNPDGIDFTYKVTVSVEQIT